MWDIKKKFLIGIEQNSGYGGKRVGSGEEGWGKLVQCVVHL
jgi:hypothetical protein